MTSILTTSALLALAVAASACTTDAPPVDDEGPYVPPAPVQLTPPTGVVLHPGDPPFVRFTMAAPRLEIAVQGNAYRPIRAELADGTGKTRLALVVDNDGHTVPLAEADFNMLATGAASADGTTMVCWNTLTGTTSDYSPTTPDPARGMALHCRTVKDGVVGPVQRIRSPTVGCWIRRLVALPDNSFRLLYKGDDGWFEASDKPDHGVYEARYQGGAWTVPQLLIPVPTVDTE